MSEQTRIDQLLQQPDACLKLAERICRKHHLPADCRRIGNDTQYVFAIAQQSIVKLFAPSPTDAFRNEITFLQALHRQLPIRTPELYAADVVDDIPYIVMEHLPGTPIETAWETLTATERRDIMRQLGAAIHALHALPIAPFQAAAFDWHTFIDRRRANLSANQRAFGLAEPWLAQVADYVESATLDLHDPAHMVPVHTELMPEHVFLSQTDTGWKVSGLIDFEPAMGGHREYEFAAVGLFLTPGNPELWRAFLLTYGYAEADLTPQFSRRIMAWLLLHRYGNLNWFLSMLPPHLHVTTLSQLEQFWYGAEIFLQHIL